MKQFISRLVASCTSTTYYRLVLFERFAHTVQFYLVFLVAIAFVLTAEYWISTLPTIIAVATATKAELVENYPEGLKINWNGEELQSSQLPVPIHYPKSFPENSKSLSKNLALIGSLDDTKTLGSTFFLVGTRQIDVLDEGRVVNTLSLKELLDGDKLEVTNDTIDAQSQQLLEAFIALFTAIGYIFPVGALLYIVCIRFFMILVESSIVFLLFKIQQVQLKYRQVVQLVISLFVPAELIHQISKFGGVELPVSMLSLSFWVLFIFVFFSLRLPSVQKD